MQQKKIFFVDICNTLADVNAQLNLRGFDTSVYPALVSSEVFDEKLFHDAEPIWPVINLVKRLAERHSIVYLTARPKGMRQVTLEWLKGYALPAGPVVHTNGRLKGDMARELVHADWISGAIEDSPSEIEGYVEAIPGIRLLIPEWTYNKEIRCGMRIPRKREANVDEEAR